MIDKTKRRSLDIDNGHLDLDHPDAFDPDVEVPGLARTPLGTEPSASDIASGQPPSPPTPETTGLDELTRERDRLRDQLLRQAAEFDNYRKRVERERRDQTDQTVVDLLQHLLAIVDDFERALRADARDEPEAYRRGVELIHKHLLDVLRRRGVKPIEALGTDFDPHVHQAITQELSPTHRDGEVIEELRRGYMLGDRLLRPAMVKVAKSS
ncbi:MAG: nucleotide exchange factor GrpE [Acidobacteria bacterium]|nr:nucleotide exchange factor GrpE [Acidobacteriota bacterium]MBI3263414.1 nucleotide exchange factor GrpE [Acidobacteriota bacterium]